MMMYTMDAVAHESQVESSSLLSRARTYVQDGQDSAAMELLQQGLLETPSDMEARLFYIDLLHKHGSRTLCDEQIAIVEEIFSHYTGFWQAWGAKKASQTGDDSAWMFVFLAEAFRNPDLRFGDVIRRGLFSYAFPLSNQASPSADVAATPQDAYIADEMPRMDIPSPQTKDLPFVSDSSVNVLDEKDASASLMTRSMAKILTEQGDVSGALDIYEHLIASASSEEERQELRAAARMLSPEWHNNSGKAEDQQETDNSSKDEILSILEALAERVEARVQN